MTISVEVFDATRRLPEPALHWIAQHAEKGMRHLGCVGEVRVRVVDDAEMAQAHEEFAGVSGTTDVLTFDLTDPDLGPPPAMVLEHARLESTPNPYEIDTDILVCLDEAARQSGGAAPGGNPPPGVQRELLLYVLHGILHCLGMDDHEEQAFEAMHRVEDGVLAAIGVGPVFRPGSPGGGSGA
ncbi:MAG TPA: rRNA maturation RNase YbeY [Phycisphaerales bacterium]|nr:rRNA maturation RNase YbeY [Phycisphaerales bacterium]